jgi:hypothetical protein
MPQREHKPQVLVKPSLRPGDIVNVKITDSAPSNPRVVGRITGQVFNAGTEYDVLVPENVRVHAVDLLTRAAPDYDWATDLPKDFWLLRNCQRHDLELLSHGDGRRPRLPGSKLYDVVVRQTVQRTYHVYGLNKGDAIAAYQAGDASPETWSLLHGVDYLDDDVVVGVHVHDPQKD